MVPAADEPNLSAPELDQHAADVRNAAVMSVGTLLSRATGLIRVSVTVAAIGTTNVVANAYFVANTTPNIVYELILGGILTSVFVPLLVDWAKRYGEDEGRIAGQRFLTFVLVVLSAVTVVAMILAPWIMRLYLIGVTDPAEHAAQLELGTFFLRWFLPQIVFYGIGAVAAGILTANRRFAAQMYAPVLNNVAVIITMLVFFAMHGKAPMTLADVSTTERLLLAAGTTLGVVAMTVALWPSLHAIGFRWRLRFDWRHETVRRLIHLARWVALYVVVNQIAYFFIIVFNGHISDGGYGTYSQAFIFFSLPHAIVAVSIFTALLPSLAGAWTDRNIPNVRELFSQGLRDTEVAIDPRGGGLRGSRGADRGAVGQLRPDAERSGGGRSDGEDARRIRGGPPLLLGVPAAHTHLLRDPGRTHACADEHRGRRGEPDRRRRARVRVRARRAGPRARVLALLPRRLGDPVPVVAAAARRRGRPADRELAAADGRRRRPHRPRRHGPTAEGIAALIDVHRPILNLVQVAVAVAAGVLAFVLGALIFQIEEADEVWRALAARFRR